MVFISLTSPESRGVATALLTFVNCLGPGCGPSVVEAWMEMWQLSRREAMGNILNLWLLAGALLCTASFTIAQDEEKLKSSLRKFAEESMSNYNAAAASTAIAAGRVVAAPISPLLQLDISASPDSRTMEAGLAHDGIYLNASSLEADRDK